MKLILMTFILCCFNFGPLWAQNTVSGTVTDEGSIPLPGVSIVVKGTFTGTSTDIGGNYTIDVAKNETLVFSYLGFTAQEILIGEKTNLVVVLQEDFTKLEEVVVIGYGTQRKSDLTGSISSVSSDELTVRPVQSVGQALQGQATGVQVRTNSAAPGGGTSIVIRGQNSVNSGSSPLYVVDGIPLDNIDNISVGDIESIEVLKDASSTAIYGSRGANGVILMTSKKGKVGKPKISYSTRFTVENIGTDLNLMNANEFATFFTDWEIAGGTDPSEVFYNGSSITQPSPSSLGEGTDWFDEITRTGYVQSHQINISGGTENSRTSVSLNYLDHQGIIKGGDYKRYGVRLANQMDITPWLTTGVNVYLTHENTNDSGENTSGEGGGGTINQAIKMSPALPVYNEDGTYTANNLPGAQGIENPLATVNELTNGARNWDVLGNFNVTVKPFKNFSFKTSFGGDFNNYKQGTYNPTTTITGGLVNGRASIVNRNTSHFVTENIFSYNNVFNDKHRLDVVAGTTYEEQSYESVSVSATNFFTDAFEYNNINAASEFGTPYSSKNKWQLLSYLGRVNYSMDGKYLVSVSARYDGSSRFGDGNKWGFFPAASGAWVVSNEDFMENTKDVVNRLKLRVGWGKTGNQNIGLQKSLAVFGLANYPVGTAIESGVSATRLANSDLRWETTKSINIGLDAKLFKRVDLTIDYYEKTTTDLLLSVSLIETSGFSSALLNTGELQNKGFEISANTSIVDNDNFKASIKTDLFLNKNEIVSLVGDATQTWKIGESLGVQRGYFSDGIIQNQEELDAYSDSDGNPINGLSVGDERAVDMNEDGVIDGDDLGIIFDPNPDFSYAVSANFSYKRLSLDLSFYGVQGNEIYNGTSSYLEGTKIIRTNLSTKLIDNTWTPSNPTAKYPRLTGETEFSKQRLRVEDGSYLRLQNIRLGYTLPKFGVFENASLYFSAQNVFTITKYSGFDPDVNSTPGNNTFGVDRNSYPNPRSFTVGFQVNF
ncbi:SusC/RagA family TonB-linked outer membrane protein [Labilibaculum antarcticum]|uniref:SusC/RagA family TonB-linked outer membrane protein n=1 Tax=Labilibaculum antarcticum TaxID=1717717 RepID=A0A1Y1CFJ9_9BACT|nr:TonB-dependent receptor [Labilibaculum antarcticum]BAX78822.1 SusC/RagA family TonB-linked outer membrane protein [Labilibaculum antarcticum]